MAARRLAVLALLLTLGLASAEFKRESTVARMKTDLTFLTSEDCEGRGPGTTGIDKAADHIAAAFKEAGLKPAMADGSYFQPFDIVDRRRAKVTKAELTLNGPDNTKIEVTKDGCTVLGMSSSGKVTGGLVFAGYCITSEKPEYDDFKGIDVAGKVVIMLRRCPRYTGDKKFGDDTAVANASALTEKIANAEKHKAAAVLMVNDASLVKESGDMLASFFTFGGSATIPCIHLKRDIADNIIRTALGKSLDTLEADIADDLKPRSADLTNWSANVDVEVDRLPIKAKNVIGVLEGSGPLANETLVIGAHYDHLGFGDSGSLERNAEQRKAMHPGADDNGSGTTTVLELARRFGAMKDRTGRRLVFMTFSGEERGLLGSAHYCKAPVFRLEDTAAMVNLDMVGRLSPDKDTKKDILEIGGTGTAKEFDALVDKYNEKTNFKLRKTASGMGPSDHQSFYLKKMPVLFFFTGIHQQYHRPTDTIDRINFDGMAKIADMAEGIITELAVAPRPEYLKTSGSLRPFQQGESIPRPIIGVMLDDKDSAPGALIASVTEKSAASKAGLQDGDRVLSIAGHNVKDAEGLAAALEQCQVNKEVDIVIKRKDEQLTLKITPTRAPVAPAMPKARLGVMPDYGDETDGMLLQGVTDGGAAEKAGLKEGDRIVELAGKPVKNVTGYMAALDTCKPGQQIEVVVKRKGERLTIKVTPQ